MKDKEILAMIEELREVDGKVVLTFFHVAGWDWPGCQIMVKGAWTGDEERRFAGKSLDETVLLAVTAKRAALEPEPQPESLPFGGPWREHIHPQDGGQAMLNAQGEIIASWIRSDLVPLVLAAPELFQTCRAILRELDEWVLRDDAGNAAEKLIERVATDVTKPESE
jgi:hypothetical protein